MRARIIYIRKIVSAIALLFTTQTITAQYCDSITPTFNVDLSGSPIMNWTSPSIQRQGNCCGTTDPDVCIEFILTLHESAAAVNFNIVSGAVPPGALFYQIDCGPQIPVGEPICLDGAGPHHLTFCKPGNNQNTFEIVSYSDPLFGPDITLNAGCQDYIYAQFYDESTVNWTSVYPGAQGAYDSYLSCTSGCDTTYVNAPTSGAPAYVDYLVCGQDINGCHVDPICDTIRVYFIAPVSVDVSPNSAHLCYGDPSLLLTSTVTGGTGPYNYSWSNGATSPNIYENAGTHVLQVTDASGCLVASDSAIITQDALPIQANAGPDQEFCQQSIPTVNLTGSVQTATGGVWMGGAGSFSPNNTSLNTSYTPTLAEVNSGSIVLSLITTGNNGCPADTDQIQINFVPFTNTITTTVSDISCFGGDDGFIHVTATGAYDPNLYSLNGGGLTSNGNFDQLQAGNYVVQIVNNLGCDTLLYFTLTQPAPLSLSVADITHVDCNGLNTGSASVAPSGGSPSYSYSWNTSCVDSVATNLSAGNYTCTVTDSKGCQASTNLTINEPTPLNLSFSTVVPNCYGANNGAISSFVSGGVPSYNYMWSTNETTSNLYNLVAGTYHLTITDDNNCQISDSVVVTQPSEMIGTITPAHVICPDENTDLTVAVNGGTGTYTYSWNPGGQNSPSVNVSPANDQAYECTIVDNNGCPLTLNTFVSVNHIYSDDLIATISDTEICDGESVFINGQYIGPDSTVSIAWLHTAVDPLQTIEESPSTTTTYILSGVNYCNDYIYDTVQVIVNPLPQIVLDPTQGEICPDEGITFYNLGDNDPSWTYLWNLGDGNYATSMNPTYSYETSGVYFIALEVTDNNGCTSESQDISQVIVNSRAVADFGMSSDEVSMLDPTIEFYNASANATTFTWSFGDGNFSSNVNPTHMYTEDGTYIVELVADNQYGCADSTTRIVHINPAFELFVPNAFTPDGDMYNDVFLPKGFGISEDGYQLLIFNRWGDIIFESLDMNVGWDGEHNGTIDSQTGVYTWVIYFQDTQEHVHKRQGHVSLLR